METLGRTVLVLSGIAVGFLPVPVIGMAMDDPFPKDGADKFMAVLTGIWAIVCWSITAACIYGAFA